MLIHADADAFFASVEARDDPALAGRAFVVAAHVVTCASYPARARGIHAGMPLAAARRLDRELIVIPPRPQAYDAASADLFALFASYTVFVEPGSSATWPAPPSRTWSQSSGTMTARKVAAICAGLDDAAIRVGGERRSAAASRTIAATRSRSTIEALCADLLSTAIARLPPRVEITRVDLAVRFDDGALVSITRPLRPPVTDLDHLPSQVASGLADTAYEQDGRGVGFVSVGLVCRPRTGDPTQLSLF